MKNVAFERRVAVACLFFGLIVAALLLRTRHDPAANRPVPEQGETKSSDSASVLPTFRSAKPVDLRDFMARLRSAGSRTQVDHLLRELEQQLASSPTNEASRHLLEILEAGDDQPTGLGFVVGADGYLKEAPTMRVFLLEQLAKTNPAAAAAYAEKILSTHASPDEWAISLRTYARRPLTGEQRQYLQEKVRALLHHAPWQKEPSVGYLEAFDVALYLRSTELAPDLAELVRLKDNQAVAQAAYLALDRLVMERPVDVLRQLQKQPELMAGRELTRAQYFARADVRDPDQKNILQGYLLNTGLTAAEAKAFAEVFPNANYMVSPNLLTRVETPSGNQSRSRDLVTLQTVTEWLRDPRFAHRHAALGVVQRRLKQFVGDPVPAVGL